MEAIKKWLKSNSTAARLTRTIAQGVISVLVVNIDYLVGFIHISPETKAILVAVIMAILSPIMAELGGKEASIDG